MVALALHLWHPYRVPSLWKQAVAQAGPTAAMASAPTEMSPIATILPVLPVSPPIVSPPLPRPAHPRVLHPALPHVAVVPAAPPPLFPWLSLPR
jgi:hypothetical protein